VVVVTFVLLVPFVVVVTFVLLVPFVVTVPFVTGPLSLVEFVFGLEFRVEDCVLQDTLMYSIANSNGD